MRSHIAVGMVLFASCADPSHVDPGTPDHIDRIERNADNGTPYFLHGALGRVTDRVTPAITGALGLTAAELAPAGVDRDQLGMTHVRFTEQLNGLRVVGGDLVLHVGRDGTVQSVTSTARDDGPGATPSLSASAAAELATRATPGVTVDVGAPALVYVISTADRSLHLAYEVQATARDALMIDLLYIDAHTGELVDRHPQVFTAKTRTVYDGQGNTFPVFFPPTLGTEAHPPTETDGLAAFTNTGLTYDCYHTLFQRDSYDNHGGALNSVVHVLFPTSSGGTSPNNAAWALGEMAYGDGDGTLMGPTARGFDVTAHELTHGVTSATAMLAYQNESGALNEASSDIMGAVCEAWRDHAVSANTWLVGEEIFTPATPNDGLRYMANPTLDAALYPPALGGSRDFYADKYTGTQDNGGVHLNSGIANLMFYLLTQGGTHPRNKTTFLVPGIGIEKSGAIYERALTMGYYTTNTTFAQARTALEMAATDLYGAGSTVTAVSFAWAAVGIGQPPAGDSVPPTVTITAPTDGATVTPGFEVDVDATDDQGVVKVELAVDGTVVGTKTAAPYMFTTDAALAAGTHVVQATAYDAFNHASDSVSVTIAATCTTNDQCGDGETCDNGMCVAGNPDQGKAGGGCCDARGGGAGTLGLGLGVMMLVGRRRRS